MIRGVAIVANRKPTIAFQRDWALAMRALKLANPLLVTFPLPPVEIVDAKGLPEPRFFQLARLFNPPPPRKPLVDREGRPTEDALAWWKEATG